MLAKRERGRTFTPEQEARLRAAFRNARALLGTWACLADAMRVPRKTLEHAMFSPARRLSGDLAIRLAWALGKPLETLYAAPTDARTCPTCGAARRP